jgi:threonine-phosphate decarboxylase
MPGHSATFARDSRALVGGARLTPQLDRNHGGDVDRWAQRAGLEASELIDFSASINPLGPPVSARKEFVKSFRKISRYPDPYGEKLKAALAARHGMDAAEVLVGNGSTQLIYLLCTALRPRSGLVVGPSFSEYANALTLAGARVRHLFLSADTGFQFSPEQFLAAWREDCDIAFLATPNSLTGRLIPKTALTTIAQIAAVKKKIVVVDEAFIDFTESESVKTMVRQNAYLLVLRSLTKYYALPGLRVGYLLGSKRRIGQIATYHEPWSVNTPALDVAAACLPDQPFAMETDRWLTTERVFLTKHLTRLGGFQPMPSHANFLLVKMPPGGNALQLRGFLLGKKILIRTCESLFGLGPRYFRIAVRRRGDNRRLVAALKEWRALSSG